MNGSFREEPAAAGRGCSSSTGRAQMKVRKGLVWQCERRRVCWGGVGGAGGGRCWRTTAPYNGPKVHGGQRAPDVYLSQRGTAALLLIQLVNVWTGG